MNKMSFETRTLVRVKRDAGESKGPYLVIFMLSRDYRIVKSQMPRGLGRNSIF